MRETGQITVFLLDDHEMVRRGVHDMLASADDVEVTGEAATAAEALERIPAARPDVALLDVRLPDGDGIEVCREIRSRDPHIACLILTSFSDEEALLHSVMAGASGYVLKGVRGPELLDAVRDVAAGRSLLDPAATRRVLERLRSEQEGGRTTAGPAPAGLPALTEQERRVLDLIGEGLTNRAIGDRMHLAEKTVKNYVSQLLGKLGMERRTQAAAYVARLRASGERPADEE